MPEKAYKGTISSVILSIVVLGILLIPFAMANHIQKLREGDGKYNFKETMCFDIDDEDYFNNDPDDVSQECGNGALGYWYDDLSLSPVSLHHSPVDGAVDGYGMGTTVTCDGYVEYADLLIFLTLTKEDIIEGDITRMDIFLTISGIEDCCYEGWLGYMFEEPSFELGEITIGELTEIEIDVNDILEINTYPKGEYLFLWFLPCEEGDDCIVQPDSIVIFDMQLYCIEEIKIGAIDWIGIAMVGGGIFMIFCSILMLPSIDFGGITKRIFKGGE